MSNRKFINKKFVKDYITKSLVSCIIESNKTISGKYHHNSTYEKAKSILTYGIFSLNEMNKKGIVNLDDDKINLLSDTTSHINGIDGISLSEIASLDFRIIQYINDRVNQRNLDENSIYADIIYKYNILLSLAKKIKEENLKYVMIIYRN